MSLRDKLTRPTQAQMEEMGGRERVYKVVRVGTRGEGRYSALAGLNFSSNVCKDHDTVAYAANMVAKSPSTNGIYIYLDKDYAKEQGQKMAGKVGSRKLELWSAKPLGAITIPAGKSKTATCSGLMLLERVATLAKPEEDVTGRVTVKTVTSAGGAVKFKLYDGGTEIGTFSSPTINKARYWKVFSFSGIKIFKK